MKTPLALLVATLLVIPTMTQAQNVTPISTPEFISKAAVSNQFEIESSKLALERGHNQSVKDFAKMMIEDHGKAGDDMDMTLKKIGYAGPGDSTVSVRVKERMQTLMTAKNFDDAYIAEQIEAHDEAVSLFGAYAETGESPSLRAFAQRTLPTLQAHQTHINSVSLAE